MSFSFSILTKTTAMEAGVLSPSFLVFFGVGRVAGFDGQTTSDQTSNGVPSLLKKRSLLFSCMGCLVTGILGLKLAGEAALKGVRRET